MANKTLNDKTKGNEFKDLSEKNLEETIELEEINEKIATQEALEATEQGDGEETDEDNYGPSPSQQP